MRRVNLRTIAEALGMKVGCGDNSCVWGPPGGMATNGGCRCHKGSDSVDLRVTMLQMQRVALHLLDVYNVLNHNSEEKTQKKRRREVP